MALALEVPAQPSPRLTSRLLDELTLRRLHYYPRALEAISHAHAMLPDSPRLEDISAHVGLTPVAFSRFFTSKIGMSFSAMLKILRIERALQQLELRDCSIELLANENGYSSSCTFTRAFKEIVGTTPSDYRRRLLS